MAPDITSARQLPRRPDSAAERDAGAERLESSIAGRRHRDGDWPIVARIAGGALVPSFAGRHRVFLRDAHRLCAAARVGPREPAFDSNCQPRDGDDRGVSLPVPLQPDPGCAPGAPSAQSNRSRDVRSVLCGREPAGAVRAVVRHLVRILLALDTDRGRAVLVVPLHVASRIFQRARSSNYLLGDIRTAEVRSIRIETLATVAFFGLLFWRSICAGSRH